MATASDLAVLRGRPTYKEYPRVGQIRPRLSPYTSTVPRNTARSEAVAIFCEIVFWIGQGNLQGSQCRLALVNALNLALQPTLASLQNSPPPGKTKRSNPRGGGTPGLAIELIQRPSQPVHINVHVAFDPENVRKGSLTCKMSTHKRPTVNPESCISYAFYFRMFRTWQLSYENKMHTKSWRQVREFAAVCGCRNFGAYERLEIPRI